MVKLTFAPMRSGAPTLLKLIERLFVGLMLPCLLIELLTACSPPEPEYPALNRSEVDWHRLVVALDVPIIPLGSFGESILDGKKQPIQSITMPRSFYMPRFKFKTATYVLSITVLSSPLQPGIYSQSQVEVTLNGKSMSTTPFEPLEYRLDLEKKDPEYQLNLKRYIRTTCSKTIAFGTFRFPLRLSDSSKIPADRIEISGTFCTPNDLK